MYLTAPGNTIPFPERIKEQFQVYEGLSVELNISFEKLGAFVTEFYHQLKEPLFFVLQLPLSIQEENLMGYDKIMHQEVLYLDGQTMEQIDSIMDSYGQILLADGISQFAIASHTAHEEIFIQKYKLIELYSKTPRLFVPLLKKYGLVETNHLITAWDTFSENYPGECTLLSSLDEIDAYKIAEILKEKGMYRAKIIDN